jgi:hypothetical protein
MTTMVAAPMLALAVFLIAAIGIYAFIILRRGKLRKRKSSEFSPDVSTAEWIQREAENAHQVAGRPGK